MVKTFAAAGLALGLTFTPLAAFAQNDMSGGAMSDKTMAPKKAMTKPHSMHKTPMRKTSMTHPDMTKGGEMQPKM